MMDTVSKCFIEIKQNDFPSICFAENQVNLPALDLVDVDFQSLQKTDWLENMDRELPEHGTT